MIINGALRVDQWHIAVAHNADLSPAKGWLYHQQTLSKTDMLNRGIRGLEIDFATVNDELRVCHGKPRRFDGKIGSYDRLSDSLKEVTDWLDQNPNEIVILFFDCKRDKLLTKERVDQTLEPLKNRIYKPSDKKESWPKLQKLIDDQKQLIIFNHKFETDYTFYSFKELRANFPSRNSDEPIEMKSKWRGEISLLNHLPHHFKSWINSAKDIAKMVLRFFFPKNAFSSINEPKSIEKQAQDPAFNGHPPNFVLMDFVEDFVDKGGLDMINQWNQNYDITN